MIGEAKNYVVRLNAGDGSRTKNVKQWRFDSEEECLDFAKRIQYIGDAQIDKALISPEEIAQLRQSLGLSMAQFAVHVGAKSQATVHEWEHGKFVPRPEMQRKLLAMLEDPNIPLFEGPRP